MVVAVQCSDINLGNKHFNNGRGDSLKYYENHEIIFTSLKKIVKYV